MDSCRVVASNRDFFLHKYAAEKIIKDYSQKRSLSPSELCLLMKARSGVVYAYTDYLIQVGKHEEAYKAMHQLATDASTNLYSDTIQWLNFLYHQGKVNYKPYFIQRNRESILRGYDNVIQGYILSSRIHNDYYKGKFMLSLSMYFLNDSIISLASDYDRASIRYVNEDNVADTLLAGNLADRALEIFLRLNQPYYTAESWLSLARCYFKIGDARQSIECLNMALANPAIDSMPDLRATISEQLSLSYSAVDDKHNSDVYRNVYLDLQDSTRQDRETEARAVSLEESANRMWGHVLTVFIVSVLLVIVTFVLVRLRKRQMRKSAENDRELEELQEQLQTSKLQVSDAMRSLVEQRARLSMVTGMIPLIERMSISVERNDMDYVRELAEETERQNRVVTQWVKLRKGIIQPRIETFDMDEILAVAKKNTAMLAASDIELKIDSEEGVRVKADRTLTLFIINTLMDNARKAMTGGGTVTVSSKINASGGYAEVTVSDTGCGMSQDQVEHLFEYKVIHDKADASSHGFGLINCRGIMDRYRKISSFFSVCDIMASSVKGQGTSVSFRLPLVVKMLCIVVMFPLLALGAGRNTLPPDSIAARYCDSLYKCNVEGRYREAMLYSDSCYSVVRRAPHVDVGVRLSLYNETAVAALALHQWEKYAFFNYNYITLYKDYTSDSTIATYCEEMERNEYWANVAVIVAVVILLSIIPLFWFVYLRHVISFRKMSCEKKQQLKESVRRSRMEHERLHILNNILDNQLSTLKHETMYYPVRICQLLSQGADTKETSAVVEYYGELYRTLCLHAMNGVSSSFMFRAERVKVKDVFNVVSDSDVCVVGNMELMTYLALLLRRNNAGVSPECKCSVRDDGYAVLQFAMSKNPQLIPSCGKLFSPDTPNVEFLIMRQIVRETANASLRYASGITVEEEVSQVTIVVTLPMSLS